MSFAALARALQQLEIVDDDQADPLLALQPPGAGAQRRDGEARRVVDIERQRLEIGGGAGEVAEILLADLAHAQRFGADPGLLGEDAGGELVGRHFEAEEGDAGAGRAIGGDAVLDVLDHPPRRVEGDVGGERGLAHAGTAGEDDEVAMMQAAGLGVERVEPGGDPGKAAAGVERLFGHLDRRGRRLGEGLDAALAAAFLGDPVERRLGILDLALGIDLVGGVERLLDHLAADADQGAQQREIVDLLGEIARADDRRARAGELGEIGRAAELLHLLVRLEHRPQRHRAGDHVAIEQAQDLLVDAAVQRLEEMLGAQLELDVLGQPVVDHQRAEQRRLGLDIVGQGLRRRRRFDEGRAGWAMRESSGPIELARLKPTTSVELVWISTCRTR